MNFNLLEIAKREVISFEDTFHLEAEIRTRDKEILNLSPVAVSGSVSYTNPYYRLALTAAYEITLASTRSLKPVLQKKQLTIDESYVDQAFAESHSELAADENIFILEDEELSVEEIVLQNIILAKPTQILSPDENDGNLPSGKDWQVLTEDEYQRIKAQEKIEQSPFAPLKKDFEK